MTFFIKIIKNPLGAIGFFLVFFWVIIAIFAPLIAPPEEGHDPYLVKRCSYHALPKAPSADSPMGVTGGGYDILYGIVWGSRTAFKVSLIVVFFSSLIGILVGGSGAYVGGYLDEIIMRVVDLFMSIPFLLAAIIMTVILGKGLHIVIIALITFGWRSYARLIRSEILSVKEREYVIAAKALGASSFRIFFRHVLPNSIYPVFVVASINMGRIVLIVSSMSFLGIGSEPGYADWGQMINFARKWIIGTPVNPFAFWYTYTYPSIAIFSFIMGWTLLGDVLRDILDPYIQSM
ncbi:Glutathione transport system permease protein GsiD [subsurface metagenome]